ncbi:uncharacterized protein LOC62_04G005915 [Vanrija pseudolonga]|uniref:Uncharacterized protein n=1 Tax=Vanrija pseudolonga TaxID=143232 RepID=A0AAF0YAH8_9TREE|nr:hypothetical protein LOC62_04G005915 [Vanrija pseudolonga]
MSAMLSNDTRSRLASIGIVIAYTGYAMWALANLGRFGGLATFGPVCLMVFSVILYGEDEIVTFPPAGQFTNAGAGKPLAWTGFLVSAASIAAGWFFLCEVDLLGIVVSHHVGLVATIVLYFVETGLWPSLGCLTRTSANQRKSMIARAIQFGWLPIAIHYALTYPNTWTLSAIGIGACVMCAIGGFFAEYYERLEAERLEALRLSLPLVDDKGAASKEGPVEIVEKEVSTASARYAICIGTSFVTTLLSAIFQSERVRNQLHIHL